MSTEDLLLKILSGCGTVFEYAYNLTQQMDPMNQGRGVLQFKSALKAVLIVSHYTAAELLLYELIA